MTISRIPATLESYSGEKMRGAVKLSKIVETWSSADPWTTFYLNKVTGKIIPITHLEFYEAEKPFSAEPEPDGKPDVKHVARAILGGDERYILIPSRYEPNESEVMEQFCFSVVDDQVSEILSESLNGPRGAEFFAQSLIRHGMLEEWHSYLQQALILAAKEWCEKNDIEFNEDV